VGGALFLKRWRLVWIEPRTLRARWLVEFRCTPKRWLIASAHSTAAYLAELALRTRDIAAQLGYTEPHTSRATSAIASA